MIRSGGGLYTPEVLALAAGLAAFPLTTDFQQVGTAHSTVCGSQIKLGLNLDTDGTILRVGILAHACAIGQAAAAIFAAAATGQSKAEIVDAHSALQDWLAGEAEQPQWPGIGAIAAARAYPARHGAVMLAWKAAASLLGEREEPR